MLDKLIVIEKVNNVKIQKLIELSELISDGWLNLQKQLDRIITKLERKSTNDNSK